MPSLSQRYALLSVLFFAALLRGGVLWVMRENLNEDRDAYREIAENLATYRVYGLGKDGEPRPTAYRPPLYPVILAKLAGEGLQVTPLRVAVLHWLLGMGTVWLTWHVAEKVVDRRQGAEWMPAVAAVLVACDPILLHWSTYVMTETLAAFLAILALYTLVRFHFDRRPLNAAFAGCALGLAVLCRPTFLPWAGLCGLSLLFLQANAWRQTADTSSAHESWLFQCLRRFANLAAFGFVAAAIVFPWGYRNNQLFGKPIITTTHGGYTFYLANNYCFYDFLLNDTTGLPWNPAAPRPKSGSPPLSFEQELENKHVVSLNSSTTRGVQEVFLSDTDYRFAGLAIRDNPLAFTYSCLYRVAQLWSPLPHKLTADESWKRALLRYAICAWYFAVYAATIAGVWRLRGKLLRSPWIWGVLLCLVFTGVHTFYWSNLRMRAPLMPVVAMVAAHGISDAIGKRRK